MITFDPIEINGITYQFRELTFNDGVKISVIDRKWQEKRLSEFLRLALDGQHDPLKMTLPIRYYLLLKYLKAQENHSILALRDIVIDHSFKGSHHIDFYENSQGVIRQLTGFDIEFIEENCKSVRETVACAIAIQFLSASFEMMPPLANENLNQHEYIQQVEKRIEFIKQLSDSEFDILYEEFEMMNHQLKSLVSYVFTNDGITLRGTDDALIRFCGLIGYSKFSRQLER